MLSKLVFTNPSIQSHWSYYGDCISYKYLLSFTSKAKQSLARRAHLLHTLTATPNHRRTHDFHYELPSSISLELKPFIVRITSIALIIYRDYMTRSNHPLVTTYSWNHCSPLAACTPKSSFRATCVNYDFPVQWIKLRLSSIAQELPMQPADARFK